MLKHLHVTVVSFETALLHNTSSVVFFYVFSNADFNS